ncbi:MAG TPA: phosphoserine phosphatase SerB [Hansschlegelia sp.]
MSSNLVAVLIASPAATVLDEALLKRASETLGGVGPRILKPGVAAEFALEAGDAAVLRASLAAALDGAPVDIAVLPAEGRRKRLLIADMDSTFIEQECIDELAEALGLAQLIAPITQRAMRGEIAFEPALRERVALFKGFVVDDVTAAILHDRVTFTPGGRTVVATMRAHGAYTALVSGGFTSFTGPVAAAIGFDENRANVLETEGGRLKGTLLEPVLGLQAKVVALDDLASSRGLTRADAIGVGDGANDVAMLAAVGLGVGFRPKPGVAEAADVRIDHGDLTALLYLQGYAEDEITTA